MKRVCSLAFLLLIVKLSTLACASAKSEELLQISPQRATTVILKDLKKPSHSFHTNKLVQGSDNEILWRWLIPQIKETKQNWLKLDITETDYYFVVFYEIKSDEMEGLNNYSEDKDLPALDKNKHYVRVSIHVNGIDCPSWTGVIDVEESKLLYLVGTSA